ncbi:hypothetical protein D8768_03355 [Enterobacter hormaechei]|nr:hypothetical protein D8768_03355 [Enterobacter hormaechei]
MGAPPQATSARFCGLPPVSGTFQTPLMISARLHGYAVRSALHRLVHADFGNVQFWHEAVTPAGCSPLSAKTDIEPIK